MPFSNKPLNILIVEDNSGDFILFETYLKQTNLEIIKLKHVETLSALNDLITFEWDLAFLDLTLPDGRGIDSFKHINNCFPKVPIIVLSGLSNVEIALECISLGAQDYLLKDDLNDKLLEKSIQHSIERKKNLEKLRESNDRYAYAAKASFDAIWDWNLQTDIIYRSEAFESLFGYQVDQEIGLHNWTSHIHPTDRERVIKGIKNAINDSMLEEWSDEYRYQKADGTFSIVNDRGILLKDENGKPYRIIGAMKDVTKIRSMQEEALNHQKQLTEASIIGQEKEKEEIGKELHDNINQLLASVKLYMDMALDRENIRIEMIAKGQEYLIHAIEEIRKLTKTLVIPSFKEYGLIDAIEEIVETMNMSGKFKTYIEVDNFNEEILDNDKKLMLYRIVQEQINNIIKHAKADQVIISIKNLDHQMTLSITDNGIGFDTAKKSKGIGLRNIDNRISIYSGNVAINSSPGNGTSLVVNLPIEIKK